MHIIYMCLSTQFTLPICWFAWQLQPEALMTLLLQKIRVVSQSTGSRKAPLLARNLISILAISFNVFIGSSIRYTFCVLKQCLLGNPAFHISVAEGTSGAFGARSSSQGGKWCEHLQHGHSQVKADQTLGRS